MTPDKAVIIERIENLSRQVASGFAGIHTRQDLTNGNVKDNTEYRLRNEKSLANVVKITYSLVGVVLIGVLGALIKLVII